MEGIFKGWIAGRTFGFIEPQDGSKDVFINYSTVPDPASLQAGSRVTFEVEETEKGFQAVTISVLSAPQRKRGGVKFWSEGGGFGFIATDDQSDDVHVAAGALPRTESGYLCVGDQVEFSLMFGKRGVTAGDLQVVGWVPGKDPLTAFADMGGTGWLQELARLAEKEPWEYQHTSDPEPLPILRNYMRYTFQRLQEMGAGIVVSADNTSAAINTGLVTPNQEDIYALFRPNPRPDRQPWRLLGFRKASDWEFVENFGASPPPLANYFDDPAPLIYDRRCELFINIDHVMEHILRFPEHLQKNPYVARQLMTSAEATTKKRVYRNYKTAIPQYYRDKGAEGTVQLLLPICLENPARADLALVVAKNEAGNAYRASTVLTLNQAYNNARLLARPDTEWLQP